MRDWAVDRGVGGAEPVWGITDLLDVWGQAATSAILANSARAFMPREQCPPRLL